MNWFNIARVIRIVLGASVLLFVVTMEIAMVARFRFTPALWFLGTSIVFFVVLIIFLFKKQNMGMLLLVLMMAIIKATYIDFGIIQRSAPQAYQIVNSILTSGSLFHGIFNLRYTIPFVHLGLLLLATVFSILGLFQKEKESK